MSKNTKAEIIKIEWIHEKGRINGRYLLLTIAADWWQSCITLSKGIVPDILKEFDLDDESLLVGRHCLVDDSTGIVKYIEAVKKPNNTKSNNFPLDTVREDLLRLLNTPGDLDWDHFLDVAKLAKQAADDEGRNMVQGLGIRFLQKVGNAYADGIAKGIAGTDNE